MHNLVKMEKNVLCPRPAVKVDCGMLNFFMHKASVQFSCAHPPRVTEGHLPSLSVPRGQAFPNPEAAPVFFIACTWFLTQNPNMEEFTRIDMQISSFVRQKIFRGKIF